MMTALLAGGCRPAAPAIEAVWILEPDQPSIGEPTRVRLTLRDRAHEPVRGARLQVEAQMTHPGMPAIVVPLAEHASGVYDALLQFSMQGHWVLVASGDVPGGGRVTAAERTFMVRPRER